MKKRIAIICILFQSFFIFSKNVTFISKDYKLGFTGGIGIEGGSDFAPRAVGLDLSSVFDQKELIVKAGIQVFPETLDITHEINYCPTLFKYFNVGTGIILHYRNGFDSFSEIDFLTGLFFKYDSLKKIDASFSILYMRKSTAIKTNDGHLPWFGDNDMALKFGFGYRPIDRVSIEFTLSSYSFYRYMLFFAPDFEIKVSVRILPKLSAGAELGMQYVDMFTLSANMNSARFRTFLTMEI